LIKTTLKQEQGVENNYLILNDFDLTNHTIFPNNNNNNNNNIYIYRKDIKFLRCLSSCKSKSASPSSELATNRYDEIQLCQVGYLS